AKRAEFLRATALLRVCWDEKGQLATLDFGTTEHGAAPVRALPPSQAADSPPSVNGGRSGATDASPTPGDPPRIAAAQPPPSVRTPVAATSKGASAPPVGASPAHAHITMAGTASRTTVSLDRTTLWIKVAIWGFLLAVVVTFALLYGLGTIH